MRGVLDEREIGDELDMDKAGMRDMGGEGLKRRYCRDLFCYPLQKMASEIRRLLSVRHVRSPNIPTRSLKHADEVQTSKQELGVVRETLSNPHQRVQTGTNPVTLPFTESAFEGIPEMLSKPRRHTSTSRSHGHVDEEDSRNSHLNGEDEFDYFITYKTKGGVAVETRNRDAAPCHLVILMGKIFSPHEVINPH